MWLINFTAGKQRVGVNARQVVVEVHSGELCTVLVGGRMVHKPDWMMVDVHLIDLKQKDLAMTLHVHNGLKVRGLR